MKKIRITRRSKYQESVLLFSVVLALVCPIHNVQLVKGGAIAGHLGAERPADVFLPLDLLLPLFDDAHDAVMVLQLILTLPEDLGIGTHLVWVLALHLRADVVNAVASVLGTRTHKVVEVLPGPLSKPFLQQPLLLLKLLLRQHLGAVNPLLLLLLTCLWVLHLVIRGNLVVDGFPETKTSS